MRKSWILGVEHREKKEITKKKWVDCVLFLKGVNFYRF